MIWATPPSAAYAYAAAPKSLTVGLGRGGILTHMALLFPRADPLGDCHFCFHVSAGSNFAFSSRYSTFTFHFFRYRSTQLTVHTAGRASKSPPQNPPSCSIAWAASPLLFTLLESRGTCVIPCGPPPPPLSLRGALALRRDRRGLKKGFCSRRTEPTTLKEGGGLPPPPSWRHCTYKAGVGWHVRCPLPPLVCPLCSFLGGDSSSNAEWYY